MLIRVRTVNRLVLIGVVALRVALVLEFLPQGRAEVRHVFQGLRCKGSERFRVARLTLPCYQMPIKGISGSAVQSGLLAFPLPGRSFRPVYWFHFF